MRSLASCLLVLGLLLASIGAAAQPDRRPEPPGRGEPDEEQDRAPRGPPVPLGMFELEQAMNQATGQHLSFTYAEDGIHDFRAGNRTLFDVRVEGEADDEEEGEDEPRTPRITREGAQLRLRMPNFTFTAHDTPTAASKLQADGRVEVSFGEGVVLARENGERVRFSYGDVTGALRGEDLLISGRTVIADESLLVILDKPRGVFDKHHRDIGTAIAKGHVGAEATFNLADGEVVKDVVSYGNVTMTTVKAERGNLTVLIEGHGFEGRVVVLNVDGRILGAESEEQLAILLDNHTVRRASNVSDILNPDDDGYQPEYYVIYDPAVEAFQLLVSVPHYSVHVLSVTTPFVLPPPSVVIGIVAGVALLVPSALVLFRRK